MPSNKPVVQAILDDKTFEKFMKIAEKEGRTKSNLAGFIIKKYVEEYVIKE